MGHSAVEAEIYCNNSVVGCCIATAVVVVYSLNKPFNPHLEFLYLKKHVFYVVNRTATDIYGNEIFAISIIEDRSGEDSTWSLEKMFAHEKLTITTTFETYEYCFGIAGN
ncbi:MAG: hypothetical protein NZ932_07390 [Candidatus Bathyarchaeota archaeon]|nr:hypothetical protein [Candidatus Bathyarchaeota archaeon]